jgi:hypothetical protein
MKKQLLIILLFCLGTTSLSFAQTEKAETGLGQIMKDDKVVGFSVAVVKNNKIIYTKSLGMQDIAKKLPLTDKAIFRIASISKSFSGWYNSSTAATNFSLSVIPFITIVLTIASIVKHLTYICSFVIMIFWFTINIS